MGVIFWASSLSGSSIPGGYSTYGHFAEYAVLGILLTWSLEPSVGFPRAVALAVLVASLYGATDELHQAFVPLRTPDAADWGVDTLAAFAGALGWMWLRAAPRRRARDPKG